MNFKRKFSSKDIIGFIIIAVLVAVFVSLVSFCFNIVNVSKPIDNTTTTQTTTTTTTTSQITEPTQPTSQESTTHTTTEIPTQPSTEPTQVTQEPTTAPEPTAPVVPVAPTREEILKKVRDGVNSLKSDTATFNALKTQTLYIQVDDLSVPFMLPTVNSIIKHFTGDKEVSEFEFVGGRGYDPEDDEETTSFEAIPPTLQYFTMTDVNGLADAKVEQTAKGTKYQITLISEESTLENTKPKYHGEACDVLDFSIFELPVGEITKADFKYLGAKISVIYNAEGRIVEYYEYMSISAVGEAGAFGISGSGAMSGYVEEQWDITWK